MNIINKIVNIFFENNHRDAAITYCSFFVVSCDTAQHLFITNQFQRLQFYLTSPRLQLLWFVNPYFLSKILLSVI